MRNLILLFGTLCFVGNIYGQGEQTEFKVSIKNNIISVQNGSAKANFTANFKIFYTSTNPKMEIRSLSECRHFAPSWQVKGLDKTKQINGVKRSEATGGDGIDDKESSSVDNRTFDVFASANQIDMQPVGFKQQADTIYFQYKKTAWGKLSSRLYCGAHGAPVFDYTFIPSIKGYFSIGYIGAPDFSLSQVTALWQPLVWQRKICPAQPYMSLAFTCPIPTTLVASGGRTIGVVATPDQMPFNPLPSQYNNRFGVVLRNAMGNVQPMIFAPVLGHSASKMEQGAEFKFSFHLWVDKAPLNMTFQNIARDVFKFKDYRHNAITTLNNTIDNIIDYTLSQYCNFIDSLKGCSYSTDVAGSTKNVSSLNPLSVALLADDEQVYQRRAYPIMEYMLSREKTLFCLDTTMKVQSPSRKMGGPCANISELAELYKLSGGKSNLFLRMADTKYYKGDAQRRVVKGSWKDALEMYRATKQEEYLERAISGADAYIQKYMNTQQEKFPNAFFWTSYAPSYVNLMELYQITGSKRYLDAALEGAREYAMYVWFTPMIPDSMVTVNKGGNAPHYWYLKAKGMAAQHVAEESVEAWRLSEIGLVSESSTTCKGHRAVFMAHHAPYMMRLANYTGDKFMYDIARSAIVGRYTNFPGYHINTERTTAYEKYDFPLRSHKELSVNSFHYNHQYPLLSVLYDYLITDVSNKAKDAIAFSGDYIEGYGYLQSKFYGNTSGKFYNRTGVWLWMPRRLIKTDNVELNYIAARGDNELLIAFTNQSNTDQHSVVEFNLDILKQLSNKSYKAELWRENSLQGEIEVTNGHTKVDVAANGITAIIIKNVKITPRFQQRMTSQDNNSWKNDYTELKFGGTRAMMLNMGRDLKRAFIYLTDDDKMYSKITCTYKIDNGPYKTISDSSYPYEFTVDLMADSKNITIRLTGETPSGQIVNSEDFSLSEN